MLLALSDDPQFWVILSKPMAKEERFEITVHYAGNEAIEAEGNGNYFPVAMVIGIPIPLPVSLASIAVMT